MQAPVANPDYATTVEDTPVDINALANDTSGSGGALSLTGVTQGAHGTVAITPTANYAVKISSGQDINAEPVLAYDKNQPWTVMATVNVAQDPTEAAIIFTNVNASPYPGYELWIDPSGLLRVRIISNFQQNNYIDVQGSVIVTDGKWHDVTATYDGSGLASGVKIYEDGVLDTGAKVLVNSLTGSIVSPTKGPLIIGNQTGWPFALNGSLDQFSISNEVHSAAYIAQYSWPGSAPPVDANTVLDYNFNEDAGTVAHDLSSSGYAGTLSSSSMWTAGPAAPATVTYTPRAGFTGTDTFSYTETDGTGTATGQVTVTVNPPSSLVANPDSATTVEDTPVDINVLANDTSGSGGALSLTGVTQGVHGTVAITPTANYAVKASSGQDINVGSVLAYDKNQPWTMMASLDVAQKPAAVAVIASNLVGSGSAHQGYQFWIDSTGHLRLRLISNYATGNYIEVQSSVVVTDGKWHDVAASYDGSSSASGVKIYLDGVQDTATKTLTNALTGSIVSPGPLLLGNQAGYESSYELNGSLDQLSMSKVVHSAAYIAQYSRPGSAAPVDANTVLDYNFNEDTGTVAHDLSSSGYAGTLSSSSMWTAGPTAPATVTYTPQAGFTGTDAFSYTETDGTGTATGQVTVTVNPPSSLVANPDSATTVEDTPVDINVLANDTSGSGGALSLTGVTQGVHGTVAITPTANYAVKASSGQDINVGSVLAYDKNQPWTMMASLDVAQKPAAVAVIASNLVGSGSAHQGYQLWIDSTGHLRLRLISNYATGNYIEVQSSVVVTDGKWHDVAVSYDGSSSASGVKIYLDGVQDTATKTLTNALTGSIVSPGPLLLGNQAGYESSYELNGSLDQLSMSKVVHSAAYIAQYSWPGSAPPVDANTVLDYNFNEDAGTVAHDLSSSGYAGTLSSSSMWTAGPTAPATVTYTPQAGFAGTDAFSYTETDGTGTATGHVTVTVNAPAMSVASADTTAATAILPRNISAASQQGSQDLGGLGSADSLVQNLVSAIAGFGASPGPIHGMDTAATQSLDPAVIASQHLIQSQNG